MNLNFLLLVLQVTKINIVKGIIITKFLFHFVNSTEGIVISLSTENGNSNKI
jgi:hypothetical protein